VIPAFTSL